MRTKPAPPTKPGSRRVLFVARRYWPAVGGVEVFLRDLAWELALTNDVTVLAHRIDDGSSGWLTDSLRPPPTFEPFDDGPVRIEPLRVPARRQLALSPLVAQITPGLRRYMYGRARVAAATLYGAVVSPVIERAGEEADAIHMFGSDLVAVAAMRAARSLRIPGVITPFAHRDQWGTGPADAYAYLLATHVIGLLEADADLYRELGVPHDRLSVCGLGSRGVSPGHGASIRRRWGISGPLVLFLGVRRDYKGLDLVVRAAPFVTAKRPDVTFAVVGPGARLEDIPESTRILDVDHAVTGAERAGWLEAADILCVPSAGESFGAVVTEGWSVGTPAVVADIPTSRELVSKAGGGVSVRRDPQALADTLVDLLKRPDQLRRLGESGRSYWSEHYALPIVARWHERLYETLGEARAPEGKGRVAA
jgi:glycosyltransferase involved in cell wall biosynthesis